MNKKYSPVSIIKRVHRKIKDRPRPLPADWYYLLWENNPVVMNVRPLWGYRPAHLMEMRMHALMENFIVKKKRFPTPVEVQSMLRSDKQLRKAIADLFHNKCLVEMHEVDYEIGIRHATSILNTPKVLENPQMVDMVERGIANAGQVIEAFYRGETQHV